MKSPVALFYRTGSTLQNMTTRYASLPTRGELAKSIGIGAEALRFYEKRGLLAEPERDGAGFRRYSEEAAIRLRFIVHAKDLGFTLREIHELLQLRSVGGDKCEDVRARIANKLNQVERKICALTLMRKCLRELVASCDGGNPVHGCPILKFIEAVETPIVACQSLSKQVGRKEVKPKRKTNDYENKYNILRR